MKKKCFFCESTHRVNSRGYCVSCWKLHEKKVVKAKKLTGFKVRVLKRWSLQGFIERGF